MQSRNWSRLSLIIEGNRLNNHPRVIREALANRVTENAPTSELPPAPQLHPGNHHHQLPNPAYPHQARFREDPGDHREGPAPHQGVPPCPLARGRIPPSSHPVQ